MTVKSITMKDFKCFEALELPCAPLTVLTGYNAAGKSTALQALLLMTQALRVAPDERKLPLNGDLVTLGSGNEVIRRNAMRKSFQLGARSTEERIAWTFDYQSEWASRGLMQLADVGYSRRGVPKKSTRRIQLVNGPSQLVSAIRDTIFLSAERTVQIEMFPVPRSSWRPQGDVGAKGEYAAYWYLEYADEEVDSARRHPEDGRETVRAQADAWLGELFPGSRVSADRSGPDSPVRLTFSPGKSSRWTQPANVGYGLSCAFPMLIAFLTTVQGSIIVVDSAEAHLHPQAQSAVGQLLGRMASAGLQIFVETHSDHLLNGIRLAVRDGLVDQRDVVLHFFGPSDNVGKVTTIAIDGKGAISDWPEGFFDQTEHDLAILAGWK